MYFDANTSGFFFFFEILVRLLVLGQKKDFELTYSFLLA